MIRVSPRWAAAALALPLALAACGGGGGDDGGGGAASSESVKSLRVLDYYTNEPDKTVLRRTCSTPAARPTA